MTDASTREQNKKSLTEFVEDNHKLLSVLGVMVALAVFAEKPRGQAGWWVEKVAAIDR